MTLPPCPIAGHDNPHHWHEKNKQIWHVDHRDGVPGIVCTGRGGLSRCYSAHVPTEAPAGLEVAADAPTPDPDEWVRVPVGTRIPAGTLLREEWPSVGFTANEDTTVQIRRSDLDAILKPAPTPAEKLAEALSDRGTETWCADVLAALDAARLTLAERADAVDVDPTTLAATPPAPQPPPDRSWVTTELIKADPRPWLIRWADDDDQDES